MHLCHGWKECNVLQQSTNVLSWRPDLTWPRVTQKSGPVKQQAQMYYGSETIDRIASWQTLMWLVPGRYSVTWNWKSNSVSRCIFTCRTILPNVIPIRFKMMESKWSVWLAAFEEGCPNKNKNKKMSSHMGSVPGPKTERSKVLTEYSHHKRIPFKNKVNHLIHNC